jgi:tetratricopeptide (TPR) repeat protein
MSHSLGPQPDPRLSLEALEEKLRALPRADVPAGLPAKLLGSIPVSKAAGASSAAATSRWFLFAVAVSLACVALSAGVYLAVGGSSSNSTKAPNEDGDPADSRSTNGTAAPTSKALNAYEQAVRVDPFNAEAWFALAKAQAAGQSSTNAEESAQKAIDVAKSRNNNELADRVEAWLRTYRASQGKRRAK